MYNSSYGKSTHKQTPEQDPSNSSSQEVNASNDLSSSSSAAGPGFEYDLSQLDQLLANGAFQHAVPLLPGNSGPVYGGGPAFGHAANNAVSTPSSFQGGGNVSTSYAQPTLSTVHSRGQTEQGTGFVGQPPTCPPNFQLSHPDVSARPDARGIPGPLWELFDVKLDYRGGDYVGVNIVFKRRRDPMSV